eukprot:m.411168 g.411168  ORF g.411168 m.411168 type:complete len:98 (+) comp56550_c0_seq10:265-558(+)
MCRTGTALLPAHSSAFCSLPMADSEFPFLAAAVSARLSLRCLRHSWSALNICRLSTAFVCLCLQRAVKTARMPRQRNSAQSAASRSAMSAVQSYTSP